MLSEEMANRRFFVAARRFLLTIIILSSLMLVVFSISTMIEERAICEEYKALYPSYTFRWAGNCFLRYQKHADWGGGYGWRDAEDVIYYEMP